MKPQTEGSTKSKGIKEVLTHESHEIEEARIAHILEHIRAKPRRGSPIHLLRIPEAKSKIFLSVKFTSDSVAERSRDHIMIYENLSRILTAKVTKDTDAANKVQYDAGESAQKFLKSLIFNLMCSENIFKLFKSSL